MARRRPPKEIAFSFDSFLDLVANVVGIILRLILVVWVGARSYKIVVEEPAPQPTKSIEAPIENKNWTAKLDQWERKITEVEHARARYEKETRRFADRLDQARKNRADLEREKQRENQKLLALQTQLKGAEEAQALAESKVKNAKVESVQDPFLKKLLATRSKLRDDLARAQRKKKSKQVLRYQVPIADPLQTQELQFECRANRVTFLDVAALVREIQNGMYANVDSLRTQWKLEKRTKAVGAFRLKYTLIRERGLLDDLVKNDSPDRRGNFSYGVSRWVAEPMKETRGEGEERALGERSEFRELIDNVDGKTTAVTFWVYPDSFPLYRALRDYCVKRGIVVAGRPLPMSIPIASSRNGTASRGQ